MIFILLNNFYMQEVKFDKSKGTVELMNSRAVEKHLFGYRKKGVMGL